MAAIANLQPFFLLLLLIFFASPSRQQLQQIQISAVDLSALLAVKNSLTDIPGADFFSTWDFTSPDPCSTFTGIVCSSSGRVTSLTLGTGLSGSPGLAGFLPAALSDLTELTQLILFPGTVTGPIPPQIGRLRNLRVISLTSNRLTGPIPDSLAGLPYLHTLDLSFNLLAGPIPAALADLPNLKVLILAWNRLSGALPPRATSELIHLDLKRNRFSGYLPPLPPSLRYLSASGNRLWGPLNGLDSLSELVYLDLSMNRFSGPIPHALFDHALSSMLLQRNNLSGTIPARGHAPPYGPGSTVDLSHNALSGELSPVLAGVETLFLNNNRLTGAVPEEYAAGIGQGRVRTLYLQHNYISEFPLRRGSPLPDSVSLCLSYNCMVPPVGLAGCPTSAGFQLSRPSWQCSAFRGGR